MRLPILCLLLASATPSVTFGCANILAVLPTSIGLSPGISPEDRQRFELRECDGLHVYAFEQGKTEPALLFKTAHEYPPILFHLSNVLAFQTLGGASDHVFVFAFKNGKPRLVLQMSTKGCMNVSLTSGPRREVTISVPPTTYPDDRGRWPPPPPPKTVVLPLD